jgi:ribose 5-phosphate isomerase B
MKIMIACDHAGLELKRKLTDHLLGLLQDVEDIGTHDENSVDYPEYAARVARAVASGEVDRGILVCGSGIGMCMTANRFQGVRAVQGWEPFSAGMSRRHNDSNVLCLGGRFIGEALAFEIVDTWLREPFEGGRHQRRLDLIEGLVRT